LCGCATKSANSSGIDVNVHFYANMHILVIPSWYFPAETDSLSGRMFHTHAAGLIEAGEQASIFYLEHTLKHFIFSKTTYQPEDGVPTYRKLRWWPPKANALLYKRWINRCAADMQQYIKKHGKPDVIHAMSYQAAGVAAEVQGRTGIPFVYTERLSAFFTGDIPKFMLPFFKPIMERASVITCVSPDLSEILQQHSPKQVRVIPNFFDGTIFSINNDVKKFDDFTWLTIGEPSHTKGLDLLLIAFAQLRQKLAGKNMRLMIADEVPEQKALKEQAVTLGIASDIVWAGQMTQPQLAKLMQQCHVYVSASRIETFGKTTIEAMACGLPVVATKTAGSKYIITNNGVGELAEIENAQSLHVAMGKVFTKYESYVPADIHNFAAKRFEKKRVVGEWIACYKSVIG
jgi:glycosyltransferase involved in cell wall biosynthesis